MKKSLLIGTALLIGVCSANAQTRSFLKPSIANQTSPILKNLPTDGNFSTSTYSGGTKNPKANGVLGGRLLGLTTYELQSNCAAPRQIINHPNGTISFIWTIDNSVATGNPNRGSGYNFWTGTGLLVPAGTTTKLEPASVRTGFSQIAVLGNYAQEVVFAHKGDVQLHDFQMSKNGAMGSNTWTGATAGATIALGTSTKNALWGRIATGGADTNTIHLLAGYSDTTSIQMGVKSPTVYSRSTDGGQSWNDQSVSLPGYDSSHVWYGSGESYALDAEGSTVAIVYGGMDQDVVLWKSTDNGTNFTRTSVDSYSFEPTFDITGTAADTAQTNDGAVTVVLGPTGTAHVAYSVTHLLESPTGATSFFPSDAELIYWNDVVKQKVNIPIALTDVDGTANGGNGTGIWEVGQFTTNINASAAPTPPSARYGNRAFLTIPSIAVDGNNVFILFSLVSDGDSTGDGQSFRDIWVVASADGGVTWGAVQNLTCTPGEEEFFSSLAKRVDSKLHFMYDLDTEPGTNIQNGDPIAASEIKYSIVDKAAVLAGTAQCSATGLGVQEHKTSLFDVTQNYPNPVSGMTYFDVFMKQTAAVTLSVFNNLGQEVSSTTEKLSAGKHIAGVDATNFAPGLYFYTITSENSSVSGKMIVTGK